MEIKQKISLKEFNTFGINAIADYFVEIKQISDLFRLMDKSEFQNSKKLILGGGSNILFTKDFEGLIIRNLLSGIKEINEDSDYIHISVAAGENWDNLVEYCVNKNFGGIENLSLIPGLVGAAPIQNIGAYGAEIKDVVFCVEGLNYKTGKLEKLSHAECKFSYRHSIFKDELKNNFFITAVTLKLKKNPIINLTYEELRKALTLNWKNTTIKNIRETVCKIRRKKLPDSSVLGNAGSFFKNPELNFIKFEELKKDYPALVGYRISQDKIKISAAWLIQECGWKGIRYGNTGSYEKQALIFVNYGGATGKEIFEFSKIVRESVKDKFDILLEYEVNIV